MFWSIFLFASGIKLLFISAYRSTDFEVHRNWMAITHTLPISKWYFDNTSEWTLDYPPFFASFEWMLSHLAKYFDPKMLDLQNLNYDSEATILFQRLSVILTDFVFALGLRKCLSALKLQNQFGWFAAGVIFFCNVGLIFVDHIHFQYNGFLFGILLLSIGFLLQERYILSCVVFASLLNFKHIYLYMAPAFGAYFLKFYCLESKHPIRNFLVLLLSGLGCFFVSFGPFYKQLPQVLSRLFPFKRGLTHAYWAPNFWALYNIADKIAVVMLKIPMESGTNTGGLVQESAHVFLPTIYPLTTFVLTGLFMVPCIIKLLWLTKERRSVRSFLQALVLCSCTAFMFGWHVHEKAILMVLIPLSLLSLSDVQDAKYAFILSVVGYYSLLPLLFSKELALIKYTLYLAYILTLYCMLKSLHKTLSFYWYEKLYFYGIAVLPTYEYIISYALKLNEKLPFLPLLLTSIYCAVGVGYIYINYYILYMTEKSTYVKVKTKLKSK